MQRWEYKSVWLWWRMANGQKPDAETVQALNDLGREGWEAVNMDKEAAAYVVLLKRPLPDDA